MIQLAAIKSSWLVYAVVILALSGCSSKQQQPSSSSGLAFKKAKQHNFDTGNICSIFETHPDWYTSAQKANQRWNLPVHVGMAFINQESGFRHDAKPLRIVANSYIPASSAYGYSQALAGTWREYQALNKRQQARRDSFDDSIDFIGWYVDRASSTLKVGKWRSYELYIAYHEGIAGYQQKTYQQKRWLQQAAKRVANLGVRYHRQLQACQAEIAELAKKTRSNPAKQDPPATKPLIIVENQTNDQKPAVELSPLQPGKRNKCGRIFVFWTACID